MRSLALVFSLPIALLSACLADAPVAEDKANHSLDSSGGDICAERGYYGTDDGCDCGCGDVDSDCFGDDATGDCDYCWGRDCSPPNNPCWATLCGPGTVCELQPSVCIALAGYTCPPRPVCVPLPDPCASVMCETGSHCELQPVLCVRAPCPPLPRCVPDSGGIACELEIAIDCGSMTIDGCFMGQTTTHQCVLCPAPGATIAGNTVVYASQDPEVCYGDGPIFEHCAQGGRSFRNKCGCGCINPPAEMPPSDCRATGCMGTDTCQPCRTVDRGPVYLCVIEGLAC